jgi:acyl-coenzyme A thioesterase PaaI-like protein
MIPPWGESWSAWIVWANTLPNLADIGMTCTHLDGATGEFVLRESVFTLNPNGGLNGGLVVAAADQALGTTALSAMPPQSLPATATISASYLRPAFPPLLFRVEVNQSGRRLVFVTVDIEDRDGRVCVRASSTMVANSEALALSDNRRDVPPTG